MAYIGTGLALCIASQCTNHTGLALCIDTSFPETCNSTNNTCYTRAFGSFRYLPQAHKDQLRAQRSVSSMGMPLPFCLLLATILLQFFLKTASFCLHRAKDKCTVTKLQVTGTCPGCMALDGVAPDNGLVRCSSETCFALFCYELLALANLDF